MLRCQFLNQYKTTKTNNLAETLMTMPVMMRRVAMQSRTANRREDGG